MWGIHAGVLEACSHVVPRVLSSQRVQILPFPLIFLLFTFTGPYNSARDVCHFPCAHRHTSPPFFTYFHLTVSASSPPSALKQYQQTYCMVRSQNTEKYKYSLLSSRAEALLAFLSKGVCICTHVCDHKHTHAPSSSWMQPLNKAWGSVSVKGLCHTLGLSHYLLVNVLNHLFYRITPSSQSSLLFCPPIPFSGPKPAVQELFWLPFTHLEQNTHLQSRILIHRSPTPNREGQPSFWVRFASHQDLLWWRKLYTRAKQKKTPPNLKGDSHFS